MAVAISLTTIFQSHPEIQKYIRYFLPETFFSAYNFLILLRNNLVWIHLQSIW